MTELQVEQVKEYALKRFPRKYNGKVILVEDSGSHYTVRVKDESPLILSKKVI